MAPSSIPHHRMVVDHCASSRCPPAVAAARIRGRRSVSPVPSPAAKISIGLAPPVHGRPPVQAPASSLIPCLQNPAEIVVRDLPIGDLLCPYPAVSHRHPQFIITLIEGWYVGMPKIYHHLIVQPVNKYAGDGVIRMNNNVIHQIAFGFEQAL
uniref:Uncharacterized protein n=1 Tax=Oryza nivara TaxID=4536 RepID=A0A0E0GVL1_ORYNI